MFIHLLILALLAEVGKTEEGVSDVCFNDCNGHGRCRNFVCTCMNNWHGDDCGIELVPHDLLPLSAVSFLSMNLESPDVSKPPVLTTCRRSYCCPRASVRFVCTGKLKLDRF